MVFLLNKEEKENKEIVTQQMAHLAP